MINYPCKIREKIIFVVVGILMLTHPLWAQPQASEETVHQDVVAEALDQAEHVVGTASTDSLAPVLPAGSVEEEEKKPAVVKLKVKVLQITLNEEYPDGVDWEAVVSNYQGLSYESLNMPEPPPHRHLSFGTLSDEDFVVLLDALDAVGTIRSVIDFDMALTEQTPQEVDISLRIPEEAPKEQLSGFAGEEDTIKIMLTPTLEDDDVLTFVLRPALIKSGEEIARFIQKEIAVAIKKKSTIVVGGMYKEKVIEERRNVPLLGQIPVLGVVFRWERKTTRKVETVIFFTHDAEAANPSVGTEAVPVADEGV